MSIWRRRPALCAAAALLTVATLLSPALQARADGPPPPPPPPALPATPEVLPTGPAHISTWLDDEGAVQVGGDGIARSLYRPEFRDAPSLQARLAHHAITGLTVQPMPPFVDVPPLKPGGAPPPPVPSRLLLLSPDASVVAQARSILRRLDAPPRSAFISILVSEVLQTSGFESGGSLLYDKGAGSEPENTLFRGYSTSFEPDSYLRSNLSGMLPFQGTALTFGDLDAGGGLFEYSLRMLSRVGCSQFIAWPNLVVTEDRPALMNATRVLPQTILVRSVDESVTYQQEEVGLKMRITPVRLGVDSAVLDLDVWLRIPEEMSDGTTLVGAMKLKLRQVQTRITLHDRQPLMLGGLVLHRAQKRRRGMPRPKELAILDPLHSALLKDDRDTEICFLIRMRSIEPDRIPAEMRTPVYRGWSRGETRTDPFGR